MAFDWSTYLVLPAAAADAKEESSSVSAGVAISGYELAGRSVHKLQFAGHEDVEEEEEEDQDDDWEEKEALRVKLDNPKLDLEDFYALMGLEDKNWRATVQEIKANWKLISFVCHPDKFKRDREWGEKRFKAMQLAFNTLTDKQKRIGYDSAVPFDESIPSAKQGLTKETFFKTYAGVFERNSKFSTVQPVPPLGDMNTSDDDVNAFYDFWLSMKSWRDFTYLDEHRSDDGTDRRTKRENERKNLKLRAGKKKEEASRMRKLIEEAMKKDPRMKAMIEKEKEEAKRRKEEKKNRFKQQQPQNKAAQERKAKEEAAAAEAAAKKAEEDAKLAATKAASNRNKDNKKFKKLCKSKRGGEYSDEDVNTMCAKATHEQMAQLITAFSLRAGPGNPPMEPQEVEAAKKMFADFMATF